MRQQTAETLTGLLVAVVAGGFLTYAVAQAGGVGAARGSYPITARFDQASGITVGSDVRLAGVKIGAVRELALDNETYEAKVTLGLNPGVKVPEDTSAKITSDSLLGGAYIALIPGGAADPLPPGGEIEITQGSVDVFNLISSVAGSLSAPAPASPEPVATETQQP
jgi:phospholipid/cholesterol/gamma-HCH transport system substrate-binding protein